MYNIYTYLKKQKEENENKKLKIIKSNNLKTDKIKREKLSKNYEKRIKNFIYQLSDNNIYSDTSLKNKEPIMRLLNNEKEYEKNKLNAINENKKYHLILNKKDIISPEKNQNIFEKKYKLNKEKILNKNEITKNNISLSANIKNKEFNSIHNNKNIINQPILRYKSRNDLERIFDVIKDLKFENENYFKCLEKYLFNLKKKKNIKEKKHLNYNDNNNNNDNNIKERAKYKKDIDEYKNMDYLELIVDNKNSKENNFKIFFNSRNKELFKNEDNKIDNLTENKNTKKTNYDFDIIETKNNIHKNLDVKTYFNGIKNYALWKDSCFVKQNINENNSKLKLSISSRNFYPKNKNNYYIYMPNKKPLSPRYKKKYKNKNEIIPLIYFLNNPQNIDLLKYKKYIVDTNNININFKSKFNIDKNSFSDELKLDQIKQIAFNKNYIELPGKKSPRIFKRRKTKIKSNLYDDTDNTEDFILRKDLSSLCNKIMKKYGQINEKYNEKKTQIIYTK